MKGEWSNLILVNSAPPTVAAAQFNSSLLFFQFFTPTLASGRQDRSLPPNLKRQSIVILNTINGNHCPLAYFPTLVAWACLIRWSCLIKVAASSSLSVITLHSAGFSVLLRCSETVQLGKVGLLAGRLASRPRGRFVG